MLSFQTLSKNRQLILDIKKKIQLLSPLPELVHGHKSGRVDEVPDNRVGTAPVLYGHKLDVDN